MSDLISRISVINLLNELRVDNVALNDKRLTEYINELPTAYNVENVVAGLEQFAKLAEDRWVNGTSNHAYQEHKCWVKAIDIVKRGGVDERT